MRFTAPVRDDTIPLEEASDVSYVLVDATSPSFSPALFANSGVCLLIQGEQLKDIAWSRKQEGSTTKVSNEWDLMFGYLVGFPRRAEQYHATSIQCSREDCESIDQLSPCPTTDIPCYLRTYVAPTPSSFVISSYHSSNREPWQEKRRRINAMCRKR